ncbi:hypothetical protein SAMN02745116_01092 [Pilibacter termitis]|uniref:Uncharacterized protein n=1 Tax=Pilibacter termitis TaxID=263852 RepID=A0A1T4MHL0_9ENTE|nr:Cna B-type domain-containing protein [Pilibacter termitis]SJZ66357.1 hypothetical protein SAMN02745116_01092 [Pilibacter termitis]
MKKTLINHSLSKAKWFCFMVICLMLVQVSSTLADTLSVPNQLEEYLNSSPATQTPPYLSNQLGTIFPRAITPRADLPSSFHMSSGHGGYENVIGNYNLEVRNLPKNFKGAKEAVFYHERSRDFGEAYYCTDVKNAVLGWEFTEQTSPKQNFSAEQKALLSHVLANGARMYVHKDAASSYGYSDEEALQNAKFGYATQIAVWIVAENVYKSGNKYPTDTPSILDIYCYPENAANSLQGTAFAQSGEIGKMARKLVTDAVIAYKAKEIPNEYKLFPSFTWETIQKAEEKKYKMQPTGNASEYKVDLLDTNNVLAQEWKANTIKVLENAGLDITVQGNVMIVKGDTSGGIIRLSCPNYELRYIIPKEENSQYMARLVNTGDTTRYISVYREEVTSHEVEKKWSDNNNQANKRPNEIKVSLYADGVEVPSSEVTLNAGNNWSHIWANLAKYQSNGTTEIRYTAREVNTPADYTVSYDDKKTEITTITNTYVSPTTTHEVIKVWNDNNNRFSKRPNEIKVRLYADNREVVNSEITLNNNNNWSHKWKDLPKYQSNNSTEIQYTVKEVSVPTNYTDFYDETKTEITTITNTYVPPTTIHEVKKVWNDNNNQFAKRPSEIKVKLYADDVEVAGSEVTLNASNGWSYQWKNLLQYQHDGTTEIHYSAKESSIPSDYDVSYDDRKTEITIITNTYVPPKTTHEVKKIWDDNNNQVGKRPSEISVKLFADDVEVPNSEVVLNAGNNWSYHWSDLPQYQSNSLVEINYTVKEVNTPSDYIVSYDNTKTVITIITNTYVPPTTTHTARKIWLDNNDQAGQRPTAIKVKLFADNAEVPNSERTLNEGNHWECTWDKLEKYRSDGKTAIVYTVQEVNLPVAYQVAYDDTNPIVTIITNTYRVQGILLPQTGGGGLKLPLLVALSGFLSVAFFLYFHQRSKHG